SKYESDRTHTYSQEAFNKFIKKNHKKYFEFMRYSVLYDYKAKKIDNTTYKFLDKKDIDISKIIAFNYVSARRNVSNTTDLELSSLASAYYERSKNQEENNSTTLEKIIKRTNNLQTLIFCLLKNQKHIPILKCSMFL
uniref:hypothetical protein n=1 Tax=Eisenbergiella tayi TaxID=1432052 RepID=UPI003FD8ADD6